MQHYNYIFTGSGLSALMTVYQLILSGKCKDKTILLLDENAKRSNDRTWCFWNNTAQFDEIISKKWNSTRFANSSFQRDLDLHPYQYNMIRGLDFYTFVFDLISQHDTIHFVNQKVLDFKDAGDHCLVKTENQSYTCNRIFNSIYTPNQVKSQSNYPLIQQHFVGWFIQSKEPVFNPDQATFMDFSVEQKGNTRFMYVLPTSSNEALVEYTLFSKDLLSIEEYESEIQKYIQKLGITDYKIVEREQGNIPMTSYPFWKHNTKNCINIGSVGGWTKASTGFTFTNTTKKAKQLVDYLEHKTTKPFQFSRKFWFYDLLLLDILHEDNNQGSRIFSGIFSSAKPQLILRFLDEETTIWEDLQLILHCPKRLFIRALISRILSGF
ncbi:MAG: lycopene cyclase [Flavobacterium sp.]|nr:lycopene cyclase [Flavobacterium sp.]